MPATAAGRTEAMVLCMSGLGRRQEFKHALQRAHDRLRAHTLPIAAEAPRLGENVAAAPRPGEAHRTDRFRVAAARRSGDAGHGDRNGRAAMLEGAASHLLRGLLAYGAVVFQRRFRDTKDLALRLVGIGDEA